MDSLSIDSLYIRVALPPVNAFSETRSGAALSCEGQRLRPTLVPGLLHDRRHFGIGHEALPTLLIPIEDHPHAVSLIRVAKDQRALRTVFLALFSAARGEDLYEAIEILD